MAYIVQRNNRFLEREDRSPSAGSSTTRGCRRRVDASAPRPRSGTHLDKAMLKELAEGDF
jgi:hypothetical protein